MSHKPKPLRPAILLMLLLSGLAPTRALAFTTRTSGSWSGYLLTGTTFSAALGTWKQPAVDCPADNARVSFWVGIDGGVSPTIEQVGTIAVCSAAGKPPAYRAWWEMFTPPTKAGSQPFEVSPGDMIAASVAYAGGSPGAYQLAVKDLTNHRHFEVTKFCGADCKRVAVEWIVERPNVGGYPLADYKNIAFTDLQFTSALPPNQGISVIQFDMKNHGNPLSTCELPENSSATSPPTRVDCKWKAAQ